MKLPVAFSLGNRSASLAQDALMRNAIAEGDPETGLRARKRPCIDSAYQATAAQGQGLFVWYVPGGETLVAITGDNLNTSPSPIVKLFDFVVEPS